MSTVKRNPRPWGDKKDEQIKDKKEEDLLAEQKPKDDKVKPKNMRVRVNVGGRIFETFPETLCKYPQARLGVCGVVDQSDDTSKYSHLKI